MRKIKQGPSAVLCEADTAIAAYTIVTLSEQESRRFLAMRDEPFDPNARLEKAMTAAAHLTRVSKLPLMVFDERRPGR